MKIHSEMPQNDVSSFGYGPSMYHNIGHVLYETIHLCGVKNVELVQLLQSPCLVPSALAGSAIEVLRGAFRAVQHRRETSATPGDSESLGEEINTLDMGIGQGEIEETIGNLFGKPSKTCKTCPGLLINLKIIKRPHESKRWFHRIIFDVYFMFDPYCPNPRMDVLCDSWVCLALPYRQPWRQPANKGGGPEHSRHVDSLIAIGETQKRISKFLLCEKLLWG